MPNYINYPTWLHPEIIKGIPITWYSLSYIIIIMICYKFIWYQIKLDKINIKRSDYEKTDVLARYGGNNRHVDWHLH